MLPLVDIGNSYVHLFKDGEIITLEHKDFFKEYAKSKLYYINVKQSLKERLKEMPHWVDIEPFVFLKGAYKGMGIDRKVLLLSRGDGLYIDAGSAITIDKYENGEFQGGVILPGIWIQKRSYAQISPVLKIEELEPINLETLPKESTQATVSYGIIAPIIALVEKINRSNLNVYCCGGDGELLSQYIKDAYYSDKLLFEGMKKVIKECKC